MSNDPYEWMRGAIGAPSDEQLEGQKDTLDAIERAAVEEARLFFDVFTQGRGPELLQWLRDHTIEVPLLDVSGSLVRGEVALSPADWAYVREGQNSVTRLIETMIARAQHEMTKGEEDGKEGN